jgi:hypothetical protein
VLIPLATEAPESGSIGELLLTNGVPVTLYVGSNYLSASAKAFLPHKFERILEVPTVFDERTPSGRGTMRLEVTDYRAFRMIIAEGRQAGKLTRIPEGQTATSEAAEDLPALRIPIATCHRMTPFEYLRGSLQGMLSRQAWPFSQVWFYAILVLGYAFLFRRWLRRLRRFWKLRKVEDFERF